MALLACHECGKQVSTEGRQCPSCGAKVRGLKAGRTGLLTKLLALIFVLGFGGFIIGQVATPEPTAEQQKENSGAAKRDSAAAMAVMALKSGLRNPASLQWQDILASEDGGIVCLDFRAQNGFGGLEHEVVTVIKGKATKDISTWNKRCTGAGLYDVKDSVLRAIARNA